MAVCANPSCRRQLTDYQWGDGYCSYHCMMTGQDRGEPASETLHDPTGKIVIAKNSAEVSAMLEAAAIDSRLPKILYMRRSKHSLRSIATAIHISESMVRKILGRCAPMLLRECGLR